MRKNSARLFLIAVSLLVVPPIQACPQDIPVEGKAKPKFRTTMVRGKVIFLGEGLDEYFGISTSKDSRQRALAILTDRGHLLPLVEDLRGRSFRTDQRLRDKTMELFVREYDRHPILQVLGIFEIKNGKKYEVDYWCDVCSIVMFEKGFCDCCQDSNRLRHRLVVEKGNGQIPKPEPSGSQVHN